MKQNALKKACLALFFLFPFSLQAQHFEWAKGYSGSDFDYNPNNYIVGAVTDNEGNLYVLGQCSPNAIYDNQDFTAGVYYHTGKKYTFMAKISPQGEMVWRKIISSAYGTHAFDIRKQGDSAIVCMVEFVISHHLYYLDTLLRTVDNTLMPLDSISVYGVTAFIWLDFDGNVLEQHFLQEAYIDTSDRVITTDIQTNGQIPLDQVFTSELHTWSFDIDNEGNIYLVKATNDLVFIRCDTCPDGYLHPNIENGLLSGYAIYLDGHRVYDIYPEGQPKDWNLMLLKFAPHFGQLTRWQYIFQNEAGCATPTATLQLRLDDKKKKELYLYGWYQFSGHHAASATLTGNPDLHFFRKKRIEGYLIKFDTLFSPKYIKQVEMNGTDTTYRAVGVADFSSVVKDDNDLFVIGTISGDGTNDYTITMDGQPLSILNPDIRKNNIFVLRLNDSTGNMKSYFKIEPLGGGAGSMALYMVKQNPVAHNNRLLFELGYDGRLPNTSDSISTLCCVGVIQCDYDGNIVGFNKFGDPAANNDYIGGVYLIDSILYATGTTYATMTFGEHVLNSTGASMAYVAKYVDTAFMTEYRPLGMITETPNYYVLQYPNPTTGTVYLDLDGEEPANVYATNMMGQRREINSKGGKIDLTNYPQGVYFLEIVTKKKVYKSKIIKL